MLVKDCEFLQLTFDCDRTGCELSRDFREPTLVCGVPILGETYDLGDDASDVKDIGD